MDWLLYCLLTLFLWGVWGFFYKLAVGNLHHGAVLFLSSLGGLLVAGVLFVSAGLKISSWGAMPLAFGAGVLGNLGTFFFIKALQGNKASLVVPLSALYPLVTVVLAVIFLGEELRLRHWLGIFLAVLAGALLGF
ncbi:EamA family transporter [Thermosulfuriphilus sp.]